jgi:hypothetical protein
MVSLRRCSTAAEQRALTASAEIFDLFTDCLDRSAIQRADGTTQRIQHSDLCLATGFLLCLDHESRQIFNH